MERKMITSLTDMIRRRSYSKTKLKHILSSYKNEILLSELDAYLDELMRIESKADDYAFDKYLQTRYTDKMLIEDNQLFKQKN